VTTGLLTPNGQHNAPRFRKDYIYLVQYNSYLMGLLCLCTELALWFFLKCRSVSSDCRVEFLNISHKLSSHIEEGE